MYSQFCELAQSRSPPATIKRMQILQMGSCKINAPTVKVNEDPIFEKQGSVNNKRVFVLQKVKYTKEHKECREGDSIRHAVERTRQFVGLEVKYCSTPGSESEKKSI